MLHSISVCMDKTQKRKIVVRKGILHSAVYAFFEKACIIKSNADVESGNSKLGNVSTFHSLKKFPICLILFLIQRQFLNVAGKSMVMLYRAKGYTLWLQG